MIRVYRLLHRTVKSSTAAAAKYLPSTAEASDTGAVISSWSVRFCRSSQISRMVFMCGASLPSPVIKILAKYENDPESLQAAGVDYAARQLCDLKEHGADGLHLYTMNRPAIAATIMERLG